LLEIQAEQATPAGAEAAQQGELVEMAPGVAAQGHVGGGGSQHHGEHGRQAQVALRPVQDLAQFRPGAAHVLQLLPPLQPLLGPGLEPRHRLALPRHQQAIGDAAAGLDQAGAGQVRLVQQQARRQGHEIAAPLALESQDRRHGEARLAHLHRVANPDAQAGGQAFVHPGLARRRQAARGRVGREQGGRGAQGAAQGVARRHRLDARQQVPVAGQRHAQEGGGVGHRQAPPARLGLQGGADGVVGNQGQVGRQQGIGLLAQGPFHPVGEERHGREAGHRQGHRQQQHANLAGAPFPQQQTRGEGQGDPHATSLPASSRN
jgi:hypothetical protein